MKTRSTPKPAPPPPSVELLMEELAVELFQSDALQFDEAVSDPGPRKIEIKPQGSVWTVISGYGLETTRGGHRFQIFVRKV